MKMSRAYAHTNIALIKYWGKLPSDQNLPATGSLSLTLDCFGTETQLSLIDEAHDVFLLNGQEQHGEPLNRIQRFLDIVRALAKSDRHCLVDSYNEVPTSSGLASSASGFAALSVATNALFDLGLKSLDLSRLARLGSGSAARSIFGDFVYMHPGSLIDKTGGYAEPITKSTDLDVSLIVVQCTTSAKGVSSRTGMIHTAQTSPFYESWIATHPYDLDGAARAIADGDFKTLGELTEHSTLKMHATMLAARPGFWYFEPLTLTVMKKVRELRQNGASCYFTMDAGPHVKVLCLSGQAQALADELSAINDVVQVTIASPGPGAFSL